ncbi:inactive dipeptidyl peptidase 10 isoform X1 [Sardina pilchardus]|uniref:inactive dipeptidyl peptidase 10 isoform X1 n=1 Tax=Sardina pilchardus TaxID=27697 RepID=UPI002E120083
MIATTQQNMTTDLDLGGSGGPPRNWKGIGIAMVVILGVMSLVLLAVVLLTPDESHLFLQSPLTVEDIESRGFKVHDPCVSWLNENEVVLRTREGQVLTYGLQSNLTSTLLDNSTLNPEGMKFNVSADKRFILLAYNIRPVFSQSFTASYAIHTVASGDVAELTPPDEETAVLQYAEWGPQGSQLVYVFDNDIYYQPDVSSQPMRLTSTGKEGLVVNGVTDWTYEEEVLLSYKALWWSVDGARLAYLTINNSATPLMEIPHFLGGIYPSNILYPYPKAGSHISSVRLFVVNLYGPAHTVEMIPPDSQRARDSYISMVSWISSTQLAVRWLNRVQNQSVLSVCEATTGACSEKNKMAVDFWQTQQQEVPLFSADGSVFYLTLPAKQGARGEFRHIASLSSQPALSSVSPRFLTSGNWDVTSLCALDEEAGKIYFLSTEESRQSRHLHSAELGGVFLRQCLTCGLVDDCNFFRVQFSPNLTYFILHCLGPGVPKVTAHGTNDPSRYTVLEDNAPLAIALGAKRLPETLYQTLSSDNYDLHIKLSLPRGYEADLLPLLVIVDGSPGSQLVTEEFSLDWPQVLSSSHSMALAWVDGRSRGARGQKAGGLLDARKPGPLRIKDQLGVVEWLMRLPYIDSRRVALYGKAFGGYLTLKMLAGTNQLFKCGVAVAPITDFKLYSAAFSERYLGLPDKEDHAYVAASLLEDSTKLKNEQLLLLHGTADARVHFQHSAELLSRLVKVEGNYSLQLYPDEGHTLREARSLQHQSRTLVHYLHNCLKPDPTHNYEEEDEDEEED